MAVEQALESEQSLFERIKNILMQPRAEWDRIALEHSEPGKLYAGYVLPLALVGAVAVFIGACLVGSDPFGHSLRTPVVTGAVDAASGALLALAGTYILALIANALAPNFGSPKDAGQAHKLAAYSATAGLVAGFSYILPQVAPLVALAGAVYSLVLLYLGLPRLMQTPDDKRVGYFMAIVVIGIFVLFIASFGLSAVRGFIPGYGAEGGYTFGRTAPAAADHAAPDQSAEIRDLIRQARALQNAGGVTVSPARVRDQLPQSLPGGFRLASSSDGATEGVARAEGVYRSADAELRLTLMQTGSVDALATVATGINVRNTPQSGDGYARMQAIDGRIYFEAVNTSAPSARYAVVGRGIALSAEGTNITLDQARAAVETVGVQRLEREFD